VICYPPFPAESGVPPSLNFNWFVDVNKSYGQLPPGWRAISVDYRDWRELQSVGQRGCE
jgi:hypothetical protein